MAALLRFGGLRNTNKGGNGKRANTENAEKRCLTKFFSFQNRHIRDRKVFLCARTPLAYRRKEKGMKLKQNILLQKAERMRCQLAGSEAQRAYGKMDDEVSVFLLQLSLLDVIKKDGKQADIRDKEGIYSPDTFQTGEKNQEKDDLFEEEGDRLLQFKAVRPFCLLEGIDNDDLFQVDFDVVETDDDYFAYITWKYCVGDEMWQNQYRTRINGDWMYNMLHTYLALGKIIFYLSGLTVMRNEYRFVPATGYKKYFLRYTIPCGYSSSWSVFPAVKETDVQWFFLLLGEHGEKRKMVKARDPEELILHIRKYAAGVELEYQMKEARRKREEEDLWMKQIAESHAQEAARNNADAYSQPEVYDEEEAMFYESMAEEYAEEESEEEEYE